ncbi:hypothetical protein [Microaceticoccus formicicus]|uniref:hypothetical protein n=1 Tax=Microaceticoccus formicicus TaxID=3118105 RepID=UPI003CCFFB6B|nr:hypothetical protein VZL98_06435 [Peptoniphilaceae bacterium AMB_02]
MKNVYKNAVFITISIIIMAYLLNMINFFLYSFESMSEHHIAIFYYAIVFVLLLTVLIFMIFINTFKLNNKYYIYLAWLYLVMFVNILSRRNPAFNTIDIKLMIICVINIVVLVVGYFKEKEL